MILGRYSLFFASLFAVVLIINTATKKNVNPMIADKAEGLKSNLEAIAWPNTAPTIKNNIGNT
jgi:hypothetical protein